MARVKEGKQCPLSHFWVLCLQMALSFRAKSTVAGETNHRRMDIEVNENIPRMGRSANSLALIQLRGAPACNTVLSEFRFGSLRDRGSLGRECVWWWPKDIAIILPCCHWLRNFACAVDEESRCRVQHAVLQRENSDRTALNRQYHRQLSDKGMPDRKSKPDLRDNRKVATCP